MIFGTNLKKHLVDKKLLISKDAAGVFCEYFDLEFYSHRANKKFKNEIEAAVHYLSQGWRENLAPSAAFDPEKYTKAYPDILTANVCPLAHYANHGFSEFRSVFRIDEAAKLDLTQPITTINNTSVSSQNMDDAPKEVDFKTRLFQGFDAEFYKSDVLKKQLLSAEVLENMEEAAIFEHYLANVKQEMLSPNRDFDEKFYRVFYQDINEAIKNGIINFGYEHFVLSGKNEGRAPKHDTKTVLELLIPTITQPTLVHNTKNLEIKLAKPKVIVTEEAQKEIVVILPRIEPDIIFGGYRAFLEFLVSLKNHPRFANTRMRWLCTETSQVNKDYFLLMFKNKDICDLVMTTDIEGYSSEKDIVVSNNDIIIAYSCWDSLLAHKIKQKALGVQIVQFIQEYEPIFHPLNSIHALVHSGFDVSDIQIFNSRVLMEYFKDNRFGIFGKEKEPIENIDYFVFEHSLTPLSLQPLKQMRTKKDRICVLYARAEHHAERNLFEILVLALRNACKQGCFDDRWRFIGVGCLSDMNDIYLSDRHSLRMVAKLPENEYKELMNGMDIGASLMYAPHPSVVPFEFCCTGAKVVVNRFLKRDKAFFENISQNFICGDTSIEGITDAFIEASQSVEDFSFRHKNALKLKRTTWRQVFNDRFMAKIAKAMRL